MSLDVTGNRRQRAIYLIAEDELTDEEIAAELGISKRTVIRWRKQPDIQAAVSELHRQWDAEIRRKGIAVQRNRVKAANDRHRKMLRVIEERAEAAEYRDVPGGQTGLLVRTMKIIGAGKNQQVIEEYSIDTGLLKELREHEKQVAQDLGQWVDKLDANITDTGLTDAERATRIAALLNAAGERRAGQAPDGGEDLDAATGPTEPGL